MPTTPALTRTDLIGADLISAVAAESDEELASGLDEDFAQMSAAQARFVVRLGEVDRRQAYRDEWAASVEARSPSTSCALSPTWPPPRPTANSATRLEHARCASWPRSPARASS